MLTAGAKIEVKDPGGVCTVTVTDAGVTAVKAVLGPADFDGHPPMTVQNGALSKELGMGVAEPGHRPPLRHPDDPCRRPARRLPRGRGPLRMRGPFRYVERVTAPARARPTALAVLPLAAAAWVAVALAPRAGAERRHGALAG